MLINFNIEKLNASRTITLQKTSEAKSPDDGHNSIDLSLITTVKFGGKQVSAFYSADLTAR